MEKRSLQINNLQFVQIPSDPGGSPQQLVHVEE